MTQKIEIIHKDFETAAILDLGKSPESVESILEILPVEGSAKVWKDEIYFDIPIEAEEENATPKTSKGDISYYPPMGVFCIFFGESQPIGPVTPLGKVENPDLFQKVREGDVIRLEK